ncbi:efflux RND transporter periplasmic adaptor subunit [Aurantimonas endophytica]|uniref:RND family efflux transporter MFP subunit n=1 Tax=Aurantimonas endophytica TaxID=1522175 RepID=A0A7W6HGW8_9HYPH|nr:efflux RND transporter periplasmic adaptor subunit [Aurantimonas endophytica]MBB4005020.1 RND family efflux transporter MFP subunit [Aurantimonas endophytica]MCO6405826.1 efflux RND transporter periplasmic adaptor subunit [Aurantimonas endophytica]
MSENRKTAESETATTPKPREPRSWSGWIAALFVLALVGWMGSGYYYPAASTDTEAPRNTERQPFTVEAFVSRARTVTEFVASEGQVSPDRMTPVRAKVGGTVEDVAVAKGDFVEEGALIARIALDDRVAQRSQAEAELARRQGEYDRVSGLAERGYATAAQVEAAQAELATARAALAAIAQTTGDTEIRAPITGVLDNFDLDLGEFVAASAEVGTVIDNDPLSVDIQIPQQSVGRVRAGQQAAVTFITGETREGTVRYVAANADAATRTFPVEITISNPERDIPAGISAQVRIPVGEIPAHFLSAALLALGPDGTLGVKAVGEDETVVFHPIKLVRAETDGIWVSGPPETMRVISVGQGFVSSGETVRVIEADPTEEVPAPDPSLAAPDTSPLVQDGEPGATTTGSVERSTLPGAEQTADDQPTEIASLLDTIGISGEGLPVRLLQQRLIALGYEVGLVDGVIGESTKEAIRQFQRSNGLEVTGEVSAALAMALFTDSAPAGSE